MKKHFEFFFKVAMLQLYCFFGKIEAEDDNSAILRTQINLHSEGFSPKCCEYMSLFGTIQTRKALSEFILPNGLINEAVRSRHARQLVPVKPTTSYKKRPSEDNEEDEYSIVTERAPPNEIFVRELAITELELIPITETTPKGSFFENETEAIEILLNDTTLERESSTAQISSLEPLLWREKSAAENIWSDRSSRRESTTNLPISTSPASNQLLSLRQPPTMTISQKFIETHHKALVEQTLQFPTDPTRKFLHLIGNDSELQDIESQPLSSSTFTTQGISAPPLSTSMRKTTVSQIGKPASEFILPTIILNKAAKSRHARQLLPKIITSLYKKRPTVDKEEDELFFATERTPPNEIFERDIVWDTLVTELEWMTTTEEISLDSFSENKTVSNETLPNDPILEKEATITQTPWLEPLFKKESKTVKTLLSDRSPRNGSKTN